MRPRYTFRQALPWAVLASLALAMIGLVLELLR